MRTERLGKRQITLITAMAKRQQGLHFDLDLLPIITHGLTYREITLMLIRLIGRGMITVNDDGAVALTADAHQWAQRFI